MLSKTSLPTLLINTLHLLDVLFYKTHFLVKDNFANAHLTSAEE